ncbi:helix-turn-helix domain-containing protein [Brevibacterium album]|uniref:helix-turn-helix domain-containing protein n=1 Tax=Brevibacterium album TaxID=417948 RepID=UPI0004027B9E|nr:helix-turn-helix domain-containing protein [Brevibacterium album]
MALTSEEYLANHPMDTEMRAQIDAHKARMLAEVRAYRLRELREQAGLTQAQLAERIGVGQRQVSKIESGDLENAKVGTVRRCLEAVGGGLALEYVAGDQRVQVA